jgi:hypothetical protein
MGAVPALARSNPIVAGAFVADRPPASAGAAKLQKALEVLFPDLLVHGTRNALLSMTTSLTKVSDRAHQYFARVSQVLAFERMMRSFVQLSAAMSPFPMNMITANCWNSLLPPSLQAHASWTYSAAYRLQTQRAPSTMTFLSQLFQPPTSASSSDARTWDYSPLFIVPMALLIAAPMTENWWNFSF